ncbi:MAG: hypothetical protein KGL39_12660 [Patescibacteria group bacterium]|nr:hypothetical protein [Patescibacteria group bacterium]
MWLLHGREGWVGGATLPVGSLAFSSAGHRVELKVIKTMSSALNLTNQKFGRLVVLRKAKNAIRKDPHTYWECRCICGKEKVLSSTHLRSGAVISCGCYNQELMAAKQWRHGKIGTPEYRSWASMRNRCLNVKGEHYHRYGGRGIKICKRWSGPNGFTNFLNDMGPKPTSKHEIERINNDGNYEPCNCRWATRQEQMLNTSQNRRFTFRGKSLTLRQWAQETGISQHTLSSRIHQYGWSIAKTLTTPVRLSRRWHNPDLVEHPSLKNLLSDKIQIRED